MKRNKFLNWFFGFIHVCLLAMPLVNLAYKMSSYWMSGYSAVVDSGSTNYDFKEVKSFDTSFQYAYYDTFVDTDFLLNNHDVENAHSMAVVFAHDTYDYIQHESSYFANFGPIFIDVFGLFGFDDYTNNFNTVFKYLFWNAYINYILICELLMFVPEVLLWFIRYCKKIVCFWDKKQFGGF